jgi:hypothetical protein
MMYDAFSAQRFDLLAVKATDLVAIDDRVQSVVVFVPAHHRDGARKYSRDDCARQNLRFLSARAIGSHVASAEHSYPETSA